MKIPQSFQVFDTDVVMSGKDQQRLSPHLSCWKRLNEILILGVNESDLQRLIVIELMESRRQEILKRLLSRYGRARQEAIVRRVQKLFIV